ncbi:MAG: flavodoxin, partial [Erysipelotrichaceae bacterium]|nr:flavodoxin [Erysipelotrichaceae bacterium]
PEIKEMPDLRDVDEIWVGYPIWWYTHPRIINTFFDQADLKGKTIHLFATSGGTGINGSLQELKKEYPSLHIVDGKRV